MKYKLIEYAYPSSDTAKKAGMPNTGCWFVMLYGSPMTIFNGIHCGGFYKDYNEAIDYANSINDPYHNKHAIRKDLIKK